MDGHAINKICSWIWCSDNESRGNDRYATCRGMVFFLFLVDEMLIIDCLGTFTLLKSLKIETPLPALVFRYLTRLEDLECALEPSVLDSDIPVLPTMLKALKLVAQKLPRLLRTLSHLQKLNLPVRSNYSYLSVPVRNLHTFKQEMRPFVVLLCSVLVGGVFFFVFFAERPTRVGLELSGQFKEPYMSQMELSEFLGCFRGPVCPGDFITTPSTLRRRSMAL